MEGENKAKGQMKRKKNEVVSKQGCTDHRSRTAPFILQAATQPSLFHRRDDMLCDQASVVPAGLDKHFVRVASRSDYSSDI